MKRERNFSFAALAALVLIALPILACRQEKPPLKVGFTGGLTGRHGELGTAGRNGALLAVEEVNEKGGINGRRILFITKDDRQDEQTAVKVDSELLAEGVVAIIGHMTSQMSVAALPLLNEKRVVMLSPTTTTNELEGKDDFFIRMEPASRKQTESLARYARQKARLGRIAVVYDTANLSYTEDYFRCFSSAFTAAGGKIVGVETFRGGAGYSFMKAASRLCRQKPEGILLIANSADAADLCHQIRKTASGRPVILSSGWAMTEEFLRKGGKSVEGVIFDNLIDLGSHEPRYRRFKDSFKNRFGEYPTFGAVHGYEAARLLAEALKVNEDARHLKETIMGFDKVYGVFGDFRLDRFGDAVRDSFIMAVKDGRLQRVE